MNYSASHGWFYTDLDRRAPAWTSVIHLYDFLTTNKEIGPYGNQVKMYEVTNGDIVQLVTDKQDYQHTLIITSVKGTYNLDNILVTAHAVDSNNRPLSSYDIKAVRFIKISGFKFNQ